MPDISLGISEANIEIDANCQEAIESVNKQYNYMKEHMRSLSLSIEKANAEIDESCQEAIEAIKQEYNDMKENMISLVDIVEEEVKKSDDHEIIFDLENSMFLRDDASYKWKVLDALATALESEYSYFNFADPYDAEECGKEIWVKVVK